MANKTILVCGYGPGISDAVAKKFGAEGFSVALVARTASRLEAGVAALRAQKVEAAAFPGDLSDPKAVRSLVESARAKLGPIAAVLYNAYVRGAGDVTTSDVAELREAFDVKVTGLVTAVQSSLADLKAHKGSVLVTNGGFGFFDPKVDAMVVQYKAMGLAIANSAQHKLASVLHERLKGDGVYVGEIMVLGTVKGTPFDQGNGTIEPSAVADKFWSLHTARSERSVNFS